MIEGSYVAVFAGSRDGADPSWRSVANELGQALALAGFKLVYGGGGGGLMGSVANGVLEAGGSVLGLIPEIYGSKADVHSRISEVRNVSTIDERKLIFKELATVFIALPGGLGTLDEIADVLNWNLHTDRRKKCVLFNLDGYFNELERFLRHAERMGMVSNLKDSLIVWNDDPNGLINELLNGLL